MNGVGLFAGRGRWAIGSVAIALGQALWLGTIVRGSGILNRSQIGPILLIGGLGWILGGAMAVAGFRGPRVGTRVVAGIGLVSNILGLAITAMTYAKWWVA